jgi:hypothetical protein
MKLLQKLASCMGEDEQPKKESAIPTQEEGLGDLSVRADGESEPDPSLKIHASDDVSVEDTSSSVSVVGDDDTNDFKSIWAGRKEYAISAFLKRAQEEKKRDQETKNVETTIDGMKKDIGDLKDDAKDLKDEIRSAQFKQIEVLGVFASILALVLAAISSAISQISVGRSLLIIVTAFVGLCTTLLIIRLLFERDNKNRPWVVSIIIFFILMGFEFGGVYLAKKWEDNDLRPESTTYNADVDVKLEQSSKGSVDYQGGINVKLEEPIRVIEQIDQMEPAEEQPNG